MQQLTPKISVLMSVYNGSAYLQESIESILHQTYSDFEFIIIDDCSTDKSAAIIAKYAQKDRRIKLITNQTNIGLTKSLNKGLTLAQGEYIARQDADDISYPARLEKEVLVLEKSADIGLVSCNINLIDSQGNSLGKLDRACDTDIVGWYLLFYNRLAGHSQVMFRRQLVIKLRGYDEARLYSQDYELWCRLINVSNIAILPEILLKQRRHADSISASKSLEQKKYSLEQSQQNIEGLINREINLEQVEYLRGFWLGHCYPDRFPDPKSIERLNPTLIELYQAFIQSKNQPHNVVPDLSQTLQLIISKQFALWIQTPLTRKQGLITKIRVSYLASSWCSSAIFSSWLVMLKNTIPTLAKVIFRPLADLKSISQINKSTRS
ncbi:MAG: glycosyltransferase [Cyanobacteria bacterium J06607_15]